MTAALCAALFLLNALLDGPLFMTGESPFRGSIESGYISMARFISRHPNPWGWDALQYCGLPTQFLYLPGMPYVTAALSHVLPGPQPHSAYRLLTGTLTCLGPVTLFLFALYFLRSRAWALAAALAYTIFSPAYGLLPHLLRDLGHLQLPWRIMALVKYGEGPHTMGLTLLPLALMAVWKAGVSRRYRDIFAAALLPAAIVLTNWIAAFSLAFCCLLFLLATWRTGKLTGLRALPIAAAGLLGYLLACFWITPSFVRTVVFNWPIDSFAYHVQRQQRLLLAGMIAGVLVLRLLFLRYPRHWYLCFVTMGAFVFGWIAVVYSEFGLDTIPESRRYAPEFEMFLLLAVVAWLRLGWNSKNSTVRLCAIGPGILMLLMGAGQGWTFLTQGWEKWKPLAREQTIEYRVASWLASRPMRGRVFASGGLRYRLDSWFDIPQVGGGWESGLDNRAPVNLDYQLRSGLGSAPGGGRLRDAELEMKALAVEYLVVHGPGSREYYRDFKNPLDFVSLPVAWHEEDDTIYELPPPSLAHLVSRAELPKAPFYWALAPLRPALEDPGRRLQTAWLDQNTLRVTGAIPPGRLVYVQMSWHRGWKATQDGRPIPLTKDGLGFLVAEAAPAAHAVIDLHFAGTAEQRICAGVSGLSWLVALTALLRKRKPK